MIKYTRTAPKNATTHGTYDEVVLGLFIDEHGEIVDALVMLYGGYALRSMRPYFMGGLKDGEEFVWNGNTAKRIALATLNKGMKNA